MPVAAGLSQRALADVTGLGALSAHPRPSRTRYSASPGRKHGKDLGEIMVIAHAVVAAEFGQPVIVLIDDGLGVAIATSEIRRLRRLSSSRPSVGSITLASTLTVLGRAAGTEHLPNRAAMRDNYRRLRELDDGLPHIEKTDLLSDILWS